MIRRNTLSSRVRHVAHMQPPNLLLVCLIAFGAVLTLLSLLALTIRLLTRCFPGEEPAPSPEERLALEKAVAKQLPGLKVQSMQWISSAKSKGA